VFNNSHDEHTHTHFKRNLNFLAMKSWDKISNKKNRSKKQLGHWTQNLNCSQLKDGTNMIRTKFSLWFSNFFFFASQPNFLTIQQNCIKSNYSLKQLKENLLQNLNVIFSIKNFFKKGISCKKDISKIYFAKKFAKRGKPHQ